MLRFDPLGVKNDVGHNAHRPHCVFALTRGCCEFKKKPISDLISTANQPPLTSLWRRSLKTGKPVNQEIIVIKRKRRNLFNNSVSILSAGDIEEDEDEEPVSQYHSMISHRENKMYT